MKIPFYYRALKSYISYHINRPTPISIMLRLTNRCNLKCPFCVMRELDKSEMPYELLKKILCEIDNLGIAYVTISGGEPMLRKDFPKLTNLISKRKFYSVLNTNGTLIDEKMVSIIANSYDAVRISIDGDQKTHDKIRGIKGSYAKSMNAIRQLSSVPGRRAKVQANFSVNEQNVSLMGNFYKETVEICDSVSFMPIINHSTKEVFGTNDFEAEWKKLSKIGKINQANMIIRKPNNFLGKKNCDAAALYFHILANGQVAPCSNISSIVLGDLHESSLKSIIRNKLDSVVVKKISNCKGCYARCTTEVSMIIRQNPLSLVKSIPGLLWRYRF